MANRPQPERREVLLGPDAPINALSRPQFVFKLLDEFVNREMRLLANEILSYVGTNSGVLSTIKKCGLASFKLGR